MSELGLTPTGEVDPDLPMACAFPCALVVLLLPV